MKNIVFLAMILTLTNLSCGSKQIWDGKDKEKSGHEMISQRFGTPISMQLADPDCQRQAGTFPLGDREVLRFDGKELRSQFVSFNGESSKLGLKSRGLMSTVFGESSQQRLTVSNGAASSDYHESMLIISEGSYFKLCAGSFGPEMDKIENVALSVLSVIEDGFNSEVLENTSIFTKESPRSTLELSLLPLLEMIYVQTDVNGLGFSLSYHATDNAVWSLERRDEQIRSRLTFYPQSEEAREQGLFGAVPLYYVPFVVAHELGHEFFFRLMPAYFQSLSSIESSLYWGESREQWHQARLSDPGMKLQATSLSQNALNNSELMVSISEGFADMFAYYLLPEQERNLSSLDCLQHRDPRLENFSHTVRKTLDSEILLSYLHKNSKSHGHLDNDERCGDVVYSDPHILGAILSHQFVNLMDQRQAPAESLKTLILWLDRLNRSLETHYFDLGPRQLLARTIYDFFLELKDQKAFSAQECKQIQENFSMYSKDWELGC